ncbi:uncharacterized protein LOC124289273 [Haliotis rubra]|uniref:uncharacterized protein LOC124289273 n=1 Tax=Haliotis rubra TaxID=36100 RepID=UPI001EE4FC47|nr:uncharacterized protein LOC124289273 [Haliotis rubra]
MGFLTSVVVVLLLWTVHKALCKGGVTATQMKTAIQRTQELTRNLSKHMDAMSGMFAESLKLMDSAETRMRASLRGGGRGGGDYANKIPVTGYHGGAVFTRWGSDTCPEGTEPAYSGFTVGGHSAHKGSGTNMLCAHSEPQFTRTFGRTTGKFNYLYGAEYEQIWRTDLTNEDAPCAVCVSITRSTATLVPGRHECMEGWHTEYWGFLVGPKHADAGNADYICLDSEPKATEGSYQDHDGRLLFNVEYQCGALPCPPYKTGFFVPCALCTI